MSEVKTVHQAVALLAAESKAANRSKPYQDQWSLRRWRAFWYAAADWDRAGFMAYARLEP